MKTRNGFVSNSSSSSFIILMENKLFDVCAHCGRSDKPYFLSEKFLNDCENSLGRVGFDEYLKYIEGQIKWLANKENKELNSELKDYYGSSLTIWKDKKKNIQKLKKKYKDMTLISFEISRDDQISNDELDRLLKENSIKIIETSSSDYEKYVENTK